MKIIEDIKMYSNGSILKSIITILLNPNFHCVLLYRIAHVLGKTKILEVFSKFIMYINRVVYCVDIDYRADLAGGFVLIHGIGTVIGKGVKTNGPVRIYQGVTLGGNNNKLREYDGRKFSQPWIKENVTIYTNSTLVGPIIVGKEAVIGANTTVMKDIPDEVKVFAKIEMVIK